MKAKIRATEELLRLAEQSGHVAYTKRDTYYYFPYWIKVSEDGSKELVRFDNLPIELKEQIQSRRDGKIEKENHGEYPS